MQDGASRSDSDRKLVRIWPEGDFEMEPLKWEDLSTIVIRNHTHFSTVNLFTNHGALNKLAKIDQRGFHRTDRTPMLLGIRKTLIRFVLVICSFYRRSGCRNGGYKAKPKSGDGETTRRKTNVRKRNSFLFRGSLEGLLPGDCPLRYYRSFLRSPRPDLNFGNYVWVFG